MGRSRKSQQIVQLASPALSDASSPFAAYNTSVPQQQQQCYQNQQQLQQQQQQQPLPSATSDLQLASLMRPNQQRLDGFQQQQRQQQHLHCPDTQDHAQQQLVLTSALNPASQLSNESPRLILPRPLPHDSLLRSSSLPSPSPASSRGAEKRPLEPVVHQSTVDKRQKVHYSSSDSNNNNNNNNNNNSDTNNTNNNSSNSSNSSNNSSSNSVNNGAGNLSGIASHHNEYLESDNGSDGDETDGNDDHDDRDGFDHIRNTNIGPDDMFEVVTEEEKRKYITNNSWWAKEDNHCFGSWMFVPENAEKFNSPGHTSGKKPVDIRREVATFVNNAMLRLEQDRKAADPNSTWGRPATWTHATVREKYRALKRQYNRCVDELKKTGNGNTRRTHLADIIKSITPYYNNLAGIFGTQINGQHTVPSRESCARDKATYILDVPDLQPRAASMDPVATKTKKPPSTLDQLEKILTTFNTIHSDASSDLTRPGATLLTAQQQELLERERLALERERAALEKDKQEWKAEMAERKAEMAERKAEMAEWKEEWKARKAQEKEDFEKYCERRMRLLDQQQEELRILQTEVQRERAQVLIQRQEWAALHKDREDLVRKLAEHGCRFDHGARSHSLDAAVESRE